MHAWCVWESAMVVDISGVWFFFFCRLSLEWIYVAALGSDSHIISLAAGWSTIEELRLIQCTVCVCAQCTSLHILVGPLVKMPSQTILIKWCPVQWFCPFGGHLVLSDDWFVVHECLAWTQSMIAHFVRCSFLFCFICVYLLAATCDYIIHHKMLMNVCKVHVARFLVIGSA